MESLSFTKMVHSNYIKPQETPAASNDAPSCEPIASPVVEIECSSPAVPASPPAPIYEPEPIFESHPEPPSVELNEQDKEEAIEIISDIQETLEPETDYEQMVIDYYEQELKMAEEILARQEEADGFVNDLFNGFKELTSLGVSKSDVREAILEQEDVLHMLKTAKLSGNFAEVFEDATGIKFDEEKLAQCHQTEVELEGVQNEFEEILAGNETDEAKQEKINEFLLNYQNEHGISYEELVNNYQELSTEYLGSANELTNVLNEYVNSQEGFIDKAANFAQIGGMGLMMAGGVACFIPGGQIIGAGMLKAGQVLAMSGTFGDNALELADLATNDKKLSEEKEDYAGLAKETLVDGALFAAGYASGTLASQAGKYALKQTGNQLFSQTVDIVADATLSLASDAAITGEVDIRGEGLSQILSILTGNVAAKIDTVNKANFDEADIFYKNGGLEEASNFLKGKGYTNKEILNHFKTQEYQKLGALFEETGNLADVLAQAQSKKLFSSGEIKNLETALQLTSLSKNGIDISKYDAYNLSTSQGKLIAQDIAMLYEAKTKGIDVNDLMVPTKADVETGKIETNVGEVFEAEGKLFIKTSDEACKELNISKETYCKLFPVLDRYSSGQQNSGDCYLVSALNAIMTNANARQNLLSCFSETKGPDGSTVVSVKLPKSDMEIILKDGQKITDLGVKKGKHMTGSLGMQLLEYGYKKSLEYDTIKNETKRIEIGEKILSEAWNKELAQWQQMGIKNYEDFKNVLADDNLEANCKKRIKEITGKDIKASEFDTIKFLLTDYWDENSNFDRLVGENKELTKKGVEVLTVRLGIDEVKANELYDTCLKDFLALSKYSTYANTNKKTQTKICNEQYYEKLGGHGGHSNNVFEAFGIENTQMVYGNNVHPKINDIIANPEKYENSVFTAATKTTKSFYREHYKDSNYSMYEYWHKNPDAYKETLSNALDELPNKNLVSGHAYSFQIIKNASGETMLEVINPWAIGNASKLSFSMTLDEFEANFTTFYIGEMG